MIKIGAGHHGQLKKSKLAIGVTQDVESDRLVALRCYVHECHGGEVRLSHEFFMSHWGVVTGKWSGDAYSGLSFKDIYSGE